MSWLKYWLHSQQSRTRSPPVRPVTYWAAARQNQQNTMCAQRNLRSAWSSTWSDQSPLCAQWVAKDPTFLHADSEDSDRTGRMPRLIWVLAGRTCHFVGFVMLRLNFAIIVFLVGYKCWPSFLSLLSHDVTKPIKCLVWSEDWSAWQSAEFDRSLRCPLEEALGLWLPIRRTEKTLIRLSGCSGWSESSLGVQPR